MYLFIFTFISRCFLHPTCIAVFCTNVLMGVVVLCKCRHIYVVEATKMHMWKQIYGKQPFCSYHCWQKIRGLPFSKACKSETITVNGDFNHTTNHNAALWNTKAFLLTTHLHLFIGLLCQTTAPAAQREGRRQIVSVCQVPLTAFNQRCCRYIAHVQFLFSLDFDMIHLSECISAAMKSELKVFYRWLQWASYLCKVALETGCICKELSLEVIKLSAALFGHMPCLIMDPFNFCRKLTHS